MGFLWTMFSAFLAVFAGLGVVGAILQKKAAKEGRIPSKEDDEILSEKKMENAADWKDRFNRARNMDEDGK